MAALAIGLASAWFVLAVVLGFGSTAAHASADDDSGGLLGAVGGLAHTATQAVGDVAATAAVVVSDAASSAPAPVSAVTAPVVQAVGTVAQTVTAPVADLVAPGVTAPIVDAVVSDPVVSTVVKLPVVSDAVAALGLGSHGQGVSGVIDGTVSDLAGTAASVGGTLASTPAHGTSPRDPATPGGSAAAPARPDVPGTSGTPALLSGSAASAPTDLGLAFAMAAARSLGGAGDSLGALAAPMVPLLAVGGLLGAAPLGLALLGGPGGIPLPLGACSTPSGPTGSGGTGSGAFALLAIGPFAAHRAWVRRRGPDDEHALPAPVFATDVSPD